MVLDFEKKVKNNFYKKNRRYGIRTHVTGMKVLCPGPLDEPPMSRMSDLNRRPADYKSAATTTVLIRQRAARAGLEPATLRLTAECTTIVLPSKLGRSGFEPLKA